MKAETTITERPVSLIAEAFERYRRQFLRITRRAPGRFANRDWSGALEDARERLDLYRRVVNDLLAELRPVLGDRELDESLWSELRRLYAERVAADPAREIAETFFNSITRRIFGTVGVNPGIEFVAFRFNQVPEPPVGLPPRTYRTEGDTAAAVRALLADTGIYAAWADPEGDARRVAEEIDAHWEAADAPLPLDELEILWPVFYRRKGAYLIGRARRDQRALPLVLALTNEPEGVKVDAVLLAEEDVSVVFSFTRSYFHVEVERPSEMIGFLRTLVPSKPVAELYTSLGFNKHGKTEFYRDLRRHLAWTDERFVRAPGERGMVMVVFTMPGYEVVFKVIRDSFPREKQISHSTIRQRYRLVFSHDRAGRLVDVQEFEHLTFDRERFDEELLEELLSSAGRNVRVEGESVVIGHLYIQRRVRPLDLYMDAADPTSARRAVLDFGGAIRELAATNVFPGDFLLKNFGVTRHGRVVFYDYDELTTVAECNFRKIPEARTPEQEMAAEPWFSVGPDDVFPEQLARFIPFSGDLREDFFEAHSDLFTVGFWREMQAMHEGGEIVDLYPYPDEARLPAES